MPPDDISPVRAAKIAFYAIELMKAKMKVTQAMEHEAEIKRFLLRAINGDFDEFRG